MKRDEMVGWLVENIGVWPIVVIQDDGFPDDCYWYDDRGEIKIGGSWSSITRSDWIAARLEIVEGQSIENSGDDVSDGSTAKYYELPEDATELQHLISHRDMNAQMGEIFRAVYRYGIASHSDKLRDAKKVKFYIDAEIERLEKLTHNS